ncbi:MAG: hypothetical protein ACOVSW_08975 [Candidatus Kapaibacteriota bacterium]
MKLFRHHIIYRLLSVVMALHILNLSVDAVDALPSSIPEDLSFNEIESVVEFILEDVLHIENALPEHDEHDEAAEITKTSVEFIALPQQISLRYVESRDPDIFFSLAEILIAPPTLDILSPPPKV